VSRPIVDNETLLGGVSGLLSCRILLFVYPWDEDDERMR
jgi:hypothetical protein